VTVPQIFVPQVPGQWRGVSCRQVRPGPSSGSGSGVCQTYSKPLRQSPPTYVHEHTYGVCFWLHQAPNLVVAAPKPHWSSTTSGGQVHLSGYVIHTFGPVMWQVDIVHPSVRNNGPELIVEAIVRRLLGAAVGATTRSGRFPGLPVLPGGRSPSSLVGQQVHDHRDLRCRSSPDPVAPT
jgi:hypothetical protein